MPYHFSFTNCLPDYQQLDYQQLDVVNSLPLGPDPLVLPFYLTVSFNVTFKARVFLPVSVGKCSVLVFCCSVSGFDTN